MFPYFKIAAKNLFSKPSTVEYPNKVTNVEAKQGYRGRIAYDAGKCTNCGMCVQVCCPGAITVTEEEVEGGKNIIRQFDLTSCTFCGTCADFCDEGSIQMTGDYHMVATDVRDLLVTGIKFKEATNDVLACSDACIFCSLCAKNCPQNAITVDRAGKHWEVDYDACVQCGKCIAKCPKKALSFRPEEEAEAMAEARKAKAEADAKAKAEADAAKAQAQAAAPAAPPDLS